jgi:tripartite-type tricarboxylate transporter receptor subunit TctC
VASALPYLQSGKVAALASVSDHRPGVLPDVPRVTENAAFASIEMSLWGGLAGPKRLPAAVVKRLSEAVQELMQDDDFVAQCTARGDEVTAYTTPDEFRAFLTSEQRRYRHLAKHLRP